MAVRPKVVAMYESSLNIFQGNNCALVPYGECLVAMIIKAQKGTKIRHFQGTKKALLYFFFFFLMCRAEILSGGRPYLSRRISRRS